MLCMACIKADLFLMKFAMSSHYKCKVEVETKMYMHDIFIKTHYMHTLSRDIRNLPNFTVPKIIYVTRFISLSYKCIEIK